MSTLKNKLLTLPQYLVPHHLLSRLIGLAAESKNTTLKNTLIENFIKIYNVNMSEAVEENPRAYPNFNAFFTRAIKPEARPLAESGLLCPADGAISQAGPINGHAIFQAKGHYYSLPQLLGDDVDRAAPFMNGDFATIYLSPRDYHRVHMPLKGTLKEMVFVPGRLFSVNNRTAETVNGLFARNERLVAIFDTEIGPVAMILVGAMIVASIETVWAGTVAPKKSVLEVTRYPQVQQKVTLERGAEMGRFKLGSTVIMLFPPNKVKFRDGLQNCTPVRMGEQFGELI